MTEKPEAFNSRQTDNENLRRARQQVAHELEISQALQDASTALTTSQVPSETGVMTYSAQGLVCEEEENPFVFSESEIDFAEEPIRTERCKPSEMMKTIMAEEERSAREPKQAKPTLELASFDKPSGQDEATWGAMLQSMADEAVRKLRKESNVAKTLILPAPGREAFSDPPPPHGQNEAAAEEPPPQPPEPAHNEATVERAVTRMSTQKLWNLVLLLGAVIVVQSTILILFMAW